MSFETESANKQFQLNIVISIDGTYYSKYQVDSGLVIDSNKIGIVDKARVNPFTVDLRNVRTTIQSSSFTLLDKDEIISVAIGNSPTQLMDSEAIIYVGFITGSFDWTDYKEISRTRINNCSKSVNTYSFNAREVVDFVNQQMFLTQDSLNADINPTDTTITTQGINITSFPTSGAIKIGDEFMQYTGISGDDLTGVSRGDRGTTATDHDQGDSILLVTDLGPINPITAMLQVMVSPGGGGTYDVLSDGLGIDQSLIDIAKFESIRDNNFSADLYDFTLYDIGNGLQFLEQEVMLATNTRLFADDGKISLALLDQIEIGAVVPKIDETSITAQPSWAINANKLVNRVVMRYDYDEATKKYTRALIFEDADSITNYGLKKTLEYKFKAVRAAQNGASIVQDRATRLLERLSTPSAEVSVSTHFSEVNNNISDKVDLEHRYLPSQGGGLGFSEQLEILSRAIDFNTGKVNFKLQFTSYSGLRIGLIAPSPLISNIQSQIQFDVPDGSCYAIGYKLELFDTLTNSFTGDPTATVQSVTGNTIVIDNVWVTTLLTTHRIKFSNYNIASSGQRASYAFIGNNGGFFDDGSKSYEIIF
jgi:hypothetical protein